MGAVAASGAPLVGGAHELFERWAALDPDRPALVASGREISYGDLNTRADRLAARLRACGVGPEVVVALLVERSVSLFVAVLAVWKARGAYVPLAAAQPPSRISLVLADTAASVVVADRDPRGLFSLSGKHIVRIDQDLGLALGGDSTGSADLSDSADGTDGSAATRTDARNLAYVLHTSGSTGTPKGVLVEHGGVVNLADGLRRRFGDLHEARVLQFAPPTFDAWVWELAMSLLNGGALCLPPAGATLSGDDLARVLRDHRATHFSASPSLLVSLPVGDPPPVSTLVAGGEALPEFLARRWAGRVRMFNAYGPTEATVSATAGRCGDRPGKPALGAVLPGVDLYVLDPAGRPAAVGELGELYVGGAGVARGYLNRPDLTALRFLPDPFAGRPGARMYRTGDLGRRRPDGEVEFVGRVDHQIKLRGFRIEPGEVEEALRAHPRVTGAVVTTAEGDGGHRRLVAYLEVSDGPPVPVPDLRAFLGARLPDYLVPSVFVALDRLPLTPHGKVDRAALPAPTGNRPPLGHDYVPPRGGTERELARLWARLLGLDRVGATDDFLALGGTSLDLVRLREAVTERWAVRLSTVDLVRAHNVRLLAARLDDPDGAGRQPTGSDPPSVRDHRSRTSQRLRARRGKG
ncbi:non-ribosomal peptide synthetase [Streptoalloteichus hindustanus]|uniref:Amino acid adenylation domain-containing protein n=1 Tax=Streptoalloteichus hindustanus TaxID=2017 RepID=A0A1M5ERA8_STRHI|nr:non-ribosomal peptide synthetase [Streptoalloteichus hindustanus]SHF81759.1 amino acid adenylation domain-containing protein [Streptoalloteichus hindustanus]